MGQLLAKPSPRPQSPAAPALARLRCGDAHPGQDKPPPPGSILPGVMVSLFAERRQYLFGYSLLLDQNQLGSLPGAGQGGVAQQTIWPNPITGHI